MSIIILVWFKLLFLKHVNNKKSLFVKQINVLCVQEQ